MLNQSEGNDQDKDRRISRPIAASMKFVSYDVLHADPSLWKCVVCKQKMSSKESLRRHILIQHIKQPVHNCNLCDESFVLNFQLLQHIRDSHSTEDQMVVHECICGLKFSKRNSLLSHIKRVHHPAPHERPTCSICGKVFNDVASFHCHERRVHGHKSIPCKESNCDKMFATVSLRNAHYRYHQNILHKCPECGKCFATRSYRDKHLLIHRGIRQYPCEECGTECITASQLGTHIKRKHQGQNSSNSEFSNEQTDVMLSLSNMSL